MPWQLSCHGMCKIVIWLDYWNQNKSQNNVQKILTVSSYNICETRPSNWPVGYAYACNDAFNEQ